MAKRARGSTTRPGQRAPIQRTGPRPATIPVVAGEVVRPESLTDAEVVRATELEAQIVAQEKAADTAATAARTRETAAPRPGGTLAQAATEEYAYVSRDVRRIAIIGGSLIALLFAAWALVTFTGLGIFQ